MAAVIPAGWTLARAFRAGLVKPHRDKKYLAWVAELPCSITGMRPVHVHHLIGHGMKAVGGKTSDYLAMPLAPQLHSEGPQAIHVVGSGAWESEFGSQTDLALFTLLYAIESGFFVRA